MCGIVTMISRNPHGFYHADTSVLESLLVLDGQFRGLDSTGAFQVQRNLQIYGVKIASNPYDLFRTDEWPKFTQRMVSSSRIVVGHNRKATQGAINSENAHPFNEGKITLIHNGTLTGGHKHMADVDVDSHAICHALAEADTPHDVLKDLKGAFALVWWDAQKNRLFAIRNTERPLFLVTTKNYHLLISESWMAEGILRRCNVDIESVHLMKDGDLYSFDTDGKYELEAVKLREPVQQYVTYGGTRYSGNVTTPRGATTTTTGQQCTECETGLTTDTDDSFRVTRIPSNSKSGVNIVGPHADTVRKEYPINDLTLIRITEFVREKDGRYKVMGRTSDPGRSAVDILGWLPASLSPQDVATYMSDHTVAKVKSHYSSVCGPSMFVDDITLDIVWPTHSPGGIGSIEWSWVVDNCTCAVCSSKLNAEEHEFTSVKRLGVGKQVAYRVVCPDCVSNSLKESNEELYNDFEQRRLDAMEDRESIGREPSRGLILLPGGASSSSLH